MTNKEKQILQFMEKLNISREEAEQLFEDDADDYIGEQGEEMTANAKNLRRYEQGDKPRKKAEKVRKVDTVKKFLLDLAVKGLMEEVSRIEYQNEVSVSFVYNDDNYSLKLTRHRKK